MVKTTAEWVYCDKNWDNNKLCSILFCVFWSKSNFHPNPFSDSLFLLKKYYIWKGGVTVWVSDLVLDFSGRANMWKCSCLPVHLENCPLKIIANGAVWSSLIFWCNICGHNKGIYPRFQSKLGRNKNINLSTYNFT